MKSKKLIFLTLIALSAISTAINAWRDNPVRRTGEEIGEGTEEIGEGNVLGGASRVVLSPAIGVFGGRSESQSDRERRRVERDEDEETAIDEEANPYY